MSSTLWLIIGCGILSIVYAVWAIQSVMAADAGNARMQEIAGAIREGATAYLTRQYTTIAIDALVALGFRRLADLHLRPSRRRHLHQGCRRRRATSSARSRPASRKTTRATRRSLPTTWATTSATAPAWQPTCSRPMRSPWSPPWCWPRSSSPVKQATTLMFPLVIGASCVVTSIIGTFFVKLGANNSIMGALYKGFIATAVLSAGALADQSCGAGLAA
jgi:hypothetical protein